MKDIGYVVSGISPGPAGVGRVLEYIIANSSSKNKFILPPLNRSFSIKNSFLKLNFSLILKSIIEIFRSKINSLHYEYSLFCLKDKNVIILHPQSVTFKKVERLILRNNVSIYIMDNSFFCLKSYNYLIESERPCFLCLEMNYKNAVKKACSSFPIYYNYDEYFHFINFLKINIEKINFITQNKAQSDLLKKQFGADIIYKEIGLLTSDLFENENLWVSDVKKKYDIVFHGDNTPAKGSKYILELSKELPEYSFLFPFKSFDNEITDNVDFIEMNWTTGLKSNILESKITFCSSMWSAPIEGSVVKTLNLGVSLGVFDSEFSFGKEIPNDSVLRLSGDVTTDIESIRRFINSEEYKKTAINGKIYIENKVTEMIFNFNKIFKN